MSAERVIIERREAIFMALREAGISIAAVQERQLLDLVDGCNAVLGLVQLVCGRDDMPPAIKEALETSHRVEEALAAVEKATGKRSEWSAR